MRKMKELWLILFLASLFHDIHGQVTPPPSTAEALGDDVSLTCTSTESTPRFTWSFSSDDVSSQPLFFGEDDGAAAPRYDNIVLRSSPDDQTSILGINAIQLEEEGQYQCSTTTTITLPAFTVVTVEVGSASQPISLSSSSPNYSNYIATCNAIGSKPGETITWILDNVIQTEGVNTEGPNMTGDSLFETTSTFTFRATVENYNVKLECNISGHQVDKLNRQETRLVDIHNPPEAEGITVGLNSEGSDLTVRCIINDAVDAAIPPMELFYIYSNGTLITKPVSANSVTVSEPDYDTEYLCVGGNYLGNTSATETFYPGRTTTPTPPTAPDTTEPVVGGPTPNPTEPVLSTGAIAGIAVGSIIAIAVIIVLIVVFVVKPDCIGGSGSPNTTTTHKHSTSAVGSSNGNEKNDVEAPLNGVNEVITQEKIKPEAAPRGHSSIKHTTDNPQQAEYAMVDRRPGGRGDSTDARGNGAGQNEQPGMHYADLDLTSSAGHSDRVVPKNEDGVVVYSSILV